MQNRVVVNIFPVRAAFQQIGVIQLLPAAGGITGRQIGFVDNPSPPVAARLSIAARPAFPAVLLHNTCKFFPKPLNALAVGYRFINSAAQIVQ